MNPPRSPTLASALTSALPATSTVTPTGVSMNDPAAGDAKAEYKIVRIYLKGASSEVPDMANVPRQAISPHVGVDMQTLANPAGPGALECVLRIALHARLDGKTIFLVEVSEAGVFEVDIGNMEDAQRFVRKIAPSVLFPFARKDLASLTVAAGFQPVLLDHIDFDSMLTQVITSQRLTRKPTPMPMRLDVIAAKPVVTPVKIVKPAVPALNAAPDWSDTQPSVPPELRRKPVAHAEAGAGRVPMPVPTGGLSSAPAPVHKAVRPAGAEKPKRSATRAAMALLGVATLGATLAWWVDRKPAPIVASATPEVEAPMHAASASPAVATGSATIASPVLAQAAKTPPETERVMQISRTRLADQPAAWFTLDMGLSPVTAPLATLLPALEPLPDRPVFVLADKDDSMRVLYGVFPSKAAAERVQSQLKQLGPMKGRQTGTVVPIGPLL